MVLEASDLGAHLASTHAHLIGLEKCAEKQHNHINPNMPVSWTLKYEWWLSSKAVNTETWVQSLGWEDLLGKEMATHSSILAWKISWAEEPGGLK